MRLNGRASAVALACVALAAAWAGCLGGESAGAVGDEASGGDEGGPGGPLVVGADVSACVEAVALFAREPEALAAHVPDGFRLADAGGLLGFPVASGRAAAFVNAFQCDSSELTGSSLTSGEVAVFVEPPRVDPPPGLPDADLNFYVVAQHASDPAVASLLDGVGFARAPGVARAELSGDAPLPVEGEASMADDEGAVYRFAFDAPAREPFTGTVRLWHVTASGVGFFDYDMRDRPTAKGRVTECAIRGGSAAHAVLGVTSCAPGDGLALVFVEQAWEGAFHHHPGAQVVG